jgi:polygalacturonase
MPVSRVALSFALVFAALPLFAQDTRKVTEPRIPTACTTLDAAIAARGGVIADADEQKLDTARIQQAMDKCSAGKAVVLRAKGINNVFLSGPLTLRTGVTLVVDANTALVASRDPRVYDISPGSCGVVNERGHGCKPLITIDGAQHAGIMGAGSIDGRGGAKLLGQNVTWWDLAHQAKIEDLNQSVPWLIVARHADDLAIYNITLRNSPGFHVSVTLTDGFTAWGVKVRTPKTARNTDAIDPGASRNVTVAYCSISTGDDDVAVGAGNGPASNISVLHNHFYSGHGMSIGSGTRGGVDHMLVDDLTIDGADNGLRIKSDRSRGGLVQNVTYRNVCIRDVKNPLVFTTLYTTFPGDQLPVYRDITLDNVRILTPGSYTFLGLDAAHKLSMKFENVFADDLANSTMLVKHADFIIGSKRGNLEPSGEGASVQQTPGSTAGTPNTCDTRFAGLPAVPTAPEMAGTVPPEDKTLYVAADGTGDFYSIQRAIDAAPKEGGVLVLVAPGTYREIVTVSKPHIRLRSANPDASKTVIINDQSNESAGGTIKSATVHIAADDFFAENITIENDYNRTHEQKREGSQAVALETRGDRGIYQNIRLIANQDTVYAGNRNCTNDGPGCIATRQYFSNCTIAGNVDFIFGDGKAVFDRCEIHSTPYYDVAFITAQSKHYPEEDSGFVLNHCKLVADPGVTRPVYLGRPWRDYAHTVYLNTEMGSHIDPAGWSEWLPTTHKLQTTYNAEYNSTGPGAPNGKREAHTHMLTEDEARQYETENFLAGPDKWDPLQALKDLQALDK